MGEVSKLYLAQFVDDLPLPMSDRSTLPKKYKFLLLFISAINFTFFFFFLSNLTFEFSQFQTNSKRGQTLPPGGDGTKS